MGEFALSLLVAAVKTLVKVLVTTFAKRFLDRRKERTAPVDSRNGSDAVK